jgi:antirestriction protein ArdC
MAYLHHKSEGRSAEDIALAKFCDLLIRRIESLQEDWHRPWCTTTLYPKNLDGRLYSASNSLMLMLHGENEGYDVPVYATFERIVAMNYDAKRQPLKDAEGRPLPTVGVQRGEKSFPVVFPTWTVVDRETNEKIKYDDYRALSDEEKERYAVYPKTQVFHVFNVASQTNLAEARPELYERLKAENTTTQSRHEGEFNRFPAFEKMITDNLWLCPIRLERQDQAYYAPKQDVVVLPSREQFQDEESFLSVAAHELSHSTGHSSRLDRLKSASMSDRSYQVEELVAELSSAVICARMGVVKQGVKDESAAYLKAWLDELRESPSFLRTTLNDVKKASSMVCQEIARVEERIKQQADVGDIDGDGITNEVADEEREQVVEPHEEIHEVVGYHRRGR